MATSSSSSSSSGDSFDIVADESEDVMYTVTLKLPKFCNNCTSDDFITALNGVIDCKEIRGLGKLKRSNEWQVTLKSTEARDKLLIKGHMTVSKKKCVMLPCGAKQVVGRIHWLPVEVRDEVIKNILQNFGEVKQFFKEKLSTEPDSPDSLIRFFLLSLNESSSVNDIPHFISVNKHQGLVIVKGRHPMCLECREVGHRKSACPSIKKKVSEKSTSKNKKVANINPLPQDDNLNAAGAASANEPNTSQKKKKIKSNDVMAVASGSASNVGGIEAAAHITNENMSHKVVDDVKCMQDLMKAFSQKMNEVLTDVGSSLNVTTKASVSPEVCESSANQNISGTNKRRKKKRKKVKTNDNYDLTAAEAISNDTSSSGQYSPKGSLDSGIALNTLSVSTNTAVNMGEIESCLTKVGLSVNSSEASSVNAGHTTTCSNKKKKKKNKKKTGSSAIPGLTQQ